MRYKWKNLNKEFRTRYLEVVVVVGPRNLYVVVDPVVGSG